MEIRAFVMLLLGLVIQLAQVRSAPDSMATESCATVAIATCCCEGSQSCPCIDSNDSTHKPSPIVPVPSELKVAFLVYPATDIAEASAPAPSLARILPITPGGIHRGYAGVPLNVAFCSLVI